MYRSCTLLGACGFGLLSFRIRKFRISSIEHYEAGRDPNMLSNIINDIFMALFGYIGSHLMCCDYIYKHRQYVIERMHFERDVGFDRDTFDLAAAAAVERAKLKEEGIKEKVPLPLKLSGKENKHLFEYPFFEFVKYSDHKLSTERLRSPEEVEHIEIQKENIEKYAGSVAHRRLEIE